MGELCFFNGKHRQAAPVLGRAVGRGCGEVFSRMSALLSGSHSNTICSVSSGFWHGLCRGALPVLRGQVAGVVSLCGLSTGREFALGKGAWHVYRCKRLVERGL